MDERALPLLGKDRHAPARPPASRGAVVGVAVVLYLPRAHARISVPAVPRLDQRSCEIPYLSHSSSRREERIANVEILRYE